MKWLEIAFAILLEVVTINHDRRRGLAFPAVLLFRLVVRIRVLHNKNEPLGIRRPGEIGDTAFDVRQFLGLSAHTVEQPHLAALFLLSFVSTRGEKCEIFVVGTPARHAFAAVAGGSQPYLFYSIPTHHPNIGIALVLFGINRTNGVGNPLSVRR